jgi:serine/threonine protein kinase
VGFLQPRDAKTSGPAHYLESAKSNPALQAVRNEIAEALAKVTSERKDPVYRLPEYNDATVSFSGGAIVMLKGNLLDRDIKPTRGMCTDAVACLHAYHARGVLHRDIRPSNFVRFPQLDARVILIDFSLAGVVGERLDPLDDQSSQHKFAPKRVQDKKTGDIVWEKEDDFVMLTHCLNFMNASDYFPPKSNNPYNA